MKILIAAIVFVVALLLLALVGRVVDWFINFWTSGE